MHLGLRTAQHKQAFSFSFPSFFFIYFQDRHKEIDIDIADIAEIKLTVDGNLGDLLLGRVRQEYILDPDLREILSCTVLDADKMIAYQDHELLLITSVVYSENFVVVGERKQEVCTLSPP